MYNPIDKTEIASNKIHERLSDNKIHEHFSYSKLVINPKVIPAGDTKANILNNRSISSCKTLPKIKISYTNNQGSIIRNRSPIDLSRNYSFVDRRKMDGMSSISKLPKVTPRIDFVTSRIKTKLEASGLKAAN